MVNRGMTATTAVLGLLCSSLLLIPGSSFTAISKHNTFGRRGMSSSCGFMTKPGVVSEALARKGRDMQMKLYPPQEIGIGDQLLSLSAYTLPLLDGINYGRFLFYEIPALGDPIYGALGPILQFYKGSPFAALAIYLLFVQIARNNTLARYVRFNFQQAIILDIALILPSLLFGLIRDAPQTVQEPLTNTIFFGFAASLGYVFFTILKREKPNQIPVISDAAEMSIGGYRAPGIP